MLPRSACRLIWFWPIRIIIKTCSLSSLAICSTFLFAIIFNASGAILSPYSEGATREVLLA